MYAIFQAISTWRVFCTVFLPMMASKPKPDGRQILLVDDDISFLTSLADILSDNPTFVVSSATNGKAAIELIETRVFDLIITDIKMPTMGGFEFVAYLSRHYPEIPVIVMTAFGTPETEVNLKLLGIAHYVEKPIDIELFLRKVDEAFDNNPATSNVLPGVSEKSLLSVLNLAESQHVQGEVIATHNGRSARFFFYNGRIAWLNASTVKRTLVSQIIENTDLKIEELKAVFDECKKHDRNFGETIVDWGLLEEDAFRELLKDHIVNSFSEVLSWRKLQVMFVPDKRSYQGRFLFEVDEILTLAEERLEMKKARSRKRKSSKTNPKPFPKKEIVAGQQGPTVSTQGEIDMSAIENAMESMREVDGFMGAAAFTSAGEILAEVRGSASNLAELGALANDVLLKSQKTTDIMGVGRGNMIHITAPKANVIVRCLNENTDFSSNEAGRAHIHMMLIVEPEGNLALAKMRLERAIQEAAPAVR